MGDDQREIRKKRWIRKHARKTGNSIKTCRTMLDFVDQCGYMRVVH